VADHREQLDRQHRQDAGHQVEDQAAEQGQAQHDEQGAAGQRGKWRYALVAGDELALQAAPAVGDGQRQALALEHALGNAAPYRDAELGALAAVAEAHLGLAEVIAGRRLDQQVRRLEGNVRARDDLEDRLFGAAGQQGTIEGEAGLGAQARYERACLVDQKGVQGGRSRPGLQVEAERAVVRHADVRTDQVADLRAQGDGVARPLRAGRDGQYHFVAVAEGLQPEQGKAVRHRPLELGPGEVPGALPVDRGRITRVAGVAPIDLPARLQFEVQPEAQLLRLAHAVARGDQAQLRVVVVEPARGRRLRRPAAERRQQGADQAAKRQKTDRTKEHGQKASSLGFNPRTMHI
jgi:hypothetical protein